MIKFTMLFHDRPNRESDINCTTLSEPLDCTLHERLHCKFTDLIIKVEKQWRIWDEKLAYGSIE